MLTIAQKNIIGMHSLCFRTEILRKSGLQLPEKIPYTDAIYSILPFEIIKNIKILDFPVYCYRIGTIGQTVDKKSMVKNIERLNIVFDKLLEFSVKIVGGDMSRYIHKYVAQNANILARTILYKKSSKEEFINFDTKIKDTNMNVYNEMDGIGKTGKIVGLLRIANYSLYPIVNLICSKIL